MQADLQGQVCRNCHPLGCQDFQVQRQQRLEQAPPLASQGKRALIIGASSGFGLAARQVLMHQGRYHTLGLFLEKAPKGEQLGSAGFYHALFSQEQGHALGLISVNINADAFLASTRERVSECIAQLGGPIDLVIYSLAAGARLDAQGQLIRSAIKPIGRDIEVQTVDLQHDQWQTQTITAASEQEIADTKAILGGQDWQTWLQHLQDLGLLAPGVRTLAFSYQGPSHTYPLYHHGTLGAAKADLEQHSRVIREQLQPLAGDARVVIGKALVTKASMYIPGFVPYLACLSKVLRAKGLEEDCLAQMQRLFQMQWPEHHDDPIRLDNYELQDDVQAHVQQLLNSLGDDWQNQCDYGYVKREFLAMHGFGMPRSEQPLTAEQLLSWLALANLND